VRSRPSHVALRLFVLVVGVSVAAVVSGAVPGGRRGSKDQAGDALGLRTSPSARHDLVSLGAGLRGRCSRLAGVRISAAWRCLGQQERRVTPVVNLDTPIYQVLFVVDLRGIEPLTSCLPSKRSTI
jgi:hypothetical protein